MRLRLLVWLIPVILLLLLGWTVLRTNTSQLSFGFGSNGTTASTTATTAAAADDAAPDASQAGPVSMAVSGDADQGRDLFNSKCAVCHATGAGQKSLTGPALAGVFGHTAGNTDSLYEFYSDVLKKSNKSWDPATLEAFLADPSGFIPGTTMQSSKIPGGLPNAGERTNLIAYLATLH